MSDRLDYYFRQRVTEAELDLGFELLEKADRNLAADIGVYGIVGGAVPTQHTPVADLTIDLSAPARAYDHAGQRIFLGTGQRVDVSIDSTGIPTDVSTAGQERWLGVFLKFARLLSDPRTDGNSQQVFFRRDESFQIVVRQGAQAPMGTATKVALVDGELLVCDVHRIAGQTQIFNADINTSRRQVFVFAQATAVAVVAALWKAISTSAGNVQTALDSVDALLAGHFGATTNRHKAQDVDYTPHGFVASANVKAALDELVDDLSATATGSAGAGLVGADAVAGVPHAMAAGSVDGQLSQILAWLNAHEGAVTGAHAASAISVLDSGNNLTAANVEAALAEILDAFEGDHFRGNETSPGQHRAIHQPNFGGTRALLWDAVGVGGGGAHFRVYADAESVWFTMNAAWNGSAWARDGTGYWAGGFRFSRLEFEVFHENTFAATFTTWSRSWRLPMSNAVNSAFELTGTVEEIGRLGMEFSNADTASHLIASGSSVTFRNRFPASPSTITFSSLNQSAGFSGNPSSYFPDRDGFGFYSYQTVPALGTVWWYGTYTAVA